MRKSLLVCIILSFCLHYAYADNVDNNREIKKLYRKGKYVLICNLYEDFPRDKYAEDDLLRIGDSYFYTKKYKEASELYNRYIFLARKENIQSDCVERFFISMFRAKEYEKIFTIYTTYRNKIPFSFKTENIVASVEYINSIKYDNRSKYTKIKDTVIEDLCCLYGLGVINDNAVYYTYESEEAYNAISSERGYNYISETLNSLKYINGLRTKVFESFSGNKRDYYRTVECLNKRLKKYFVSNYAMDPKEEYVVFTDFSGSRSNTRLCYLNKMNGEWGKVKSLNFCKSLCDYGMPVFDREGKRLYFISNMQGGYGGWDLYYSEKTENGPWSEPKNVGPKINTPGDEMYPYIDNSGSLYFSSNSHPGCGGFDIYKVEEIDSKIKVRNLGYPINSENDDISCVYNTENDKLFVLTQFVENRKAKAVLKKYLIPEDREYFSKDEKQRELLVNESNKSSQKVPNAISLSKDANSVYVRNINVVAKKSDELENIPSKIKEVNVSDRVVKNGVLSCSKSLDTIASEFYFGYNSFKLNDHCKGTLKKLIGRLRNVEGNVFYIIGYADTTGNEQYNLWLSGKRAGSIGAFLVSEYGAKPENIYITARGEYLSDSDSCRYRRADLKIDTKANNPYKLTVSYANQRDVSIKKLAVMFNIEEQAINTLNICKTNYDTLRKGSIITVPVIALHKVVKGETLKTIVKKYSASEEDVLRVNNLTNSKITLKARVLYIPYSLNDEKMPISVVNSNSKNRDI